MITKRWKDVYWLAPLVALVLLWGGCAQQITPSGGPKDTTPPKVEASAPLNGSTNFSGSTITLAFDEFVQIQSLSQAIVISPPLKYAPNLKLRGKKLTIGIKDTLKPETTYLINFGDGIKDITEGNPLDSNVFVFSTGDFIDSLFVRGSIKNAFDLSPAAEVWVMLYDNMADTVPMSERPSYFAKAKKDGTFQIDYVRPGNFKLFALSDINNNYLFDLPDEPIAYTDSVIDPSDDRALHNLSMFTQEIELQYVKNGESDQFGRVVFYFNKPTENPQVRALNRDLPDDWAIRELSKSKDTLTYWIKAPQPDTLEFEVRDLATPMDTVEIILKDKDAYTRGKSKKKKPSEKVEFGHGVRGEKFDAFRKLVLNASSPIDRLQKGRIKLTENDSVVPIEVKLDPEVKRQFEIVYDWKEERNYELLIPAGAATDFAGLQNDSLQLKFATLKPDDYGNLALKVNLPETETTPQYVVQLTDKAGAVLEEHTLTENGIINYDNLRPGSYGVKLIYDANSNGKWDTGKYTREEKRQPEKVIFYSGTIDIRANWDLEQEWNTEPKGFGKGKK